MLIAHKCKLQSKTLGIVERTIFLDVRLSPVLGRYLLSKKDQPLFATGNLGLGNFVNMTNLVNLLSKKDQSSFARGNLGLGDFVNMGNLVMARARKFMVSTIL